MKIHELCGSSPRIEDMTDDWVEEHMKDVTVAASQLHNEVSGFESPRFAQANLSRKEIQGTKGLGNPTVLPGHWKC